jgi:hypothetical protein
MVQYRTVEGEGSATANTPTNLTTFGAETAVGPVKVPAGASRIVELWLAIGIDVDTAGDSVGYVMRLSGKGMKDGDQDFTIGAGGGGVTNTGNWAQMPAILPVDINVVANETINVAVQYTGDTTGAATHCVTLVFA